MTFNLVTTFWRATARESEDATAQQTAATRPRRTGRRGRRCSSADCSAREMKSRDKWRSLSCWHLVAVKSNFSICVNFFIFQLESPFYGYLWWSVSAFLLSAAVPEIIDGNTLTATVVDLNAWVEYEFRVLAKNGVGVGEPSPVSVRTRTEDAGPSLVALSIMTCHWARSFNFVLNIIMHSKYSNSIMCFQISHIKTPENLSHRVTVHLKNVHYHNLP